MRRRETNTPSLHDTFFYSNLPLSSPLKILHLRKTFVFSPICLAEFIFYFLFESFCKREGISAWFDTSAKEQGHNISLAVHGLINCILSSDGCMVKQHILPDEVRTYVLNAVSSHMNSNYDWMRLFLLIDRVVYCQLYIVRMRRHCARMQLLCNCMYICMCMCVCMSVCAYVCEKERECLSDHHHDPHRTWTLNTCPQCPQTHLDSDYDTDSNCLFFVI
jgi:hypothetical protein